MTTNSIQFHSGSAGLEVLRLSKDGIWANPDIPADEAAKLVLEAIDCNIKALVDRAVADEREAIIVLVRRYTNNKDLEQAIRARNNMNT